MHKHIKEFTTDDAVFMAHDAAPTLLALVHSAGPGMWRIVQVAGKKNEACAAMIEQRFTDGLVAAMAASGHRLVNLDAWDALNRLSWHVGRNGEYGLDLDGDDIELVA